MRILVTGGAGYIGSVLVGNLLDSGHHVTVLDRFSFSQATLLDRCIDNRFQVVRGDCRDRSMMRNALRTADAVIPLAAIVGAPACAADETAARTTNLDAVRLLLELRSPSQRIVFPNTNSGYGIGDAERFCTEEAPLRPLSLYGRTKVEAEEAILAAGNGIALRLATVFGMSPRMRFDLLVNDFVRRAVVDRVVVLFEAHAMRNFIHVRDVARAFEHALDGFEEMKDEAFNVGLSTANLSKWELCERIQEVLPSFTFLESPVGEDPDKRDFIVSNEKFEATGFKPCHSLETGIREIAKGCAMLREARYANNL